MGLRGRKPSDRTHARNQKVWRAYLLAQVLGYWPARVDRIAEVSRRTRIPPHLVTSVVDCTSPIGCYEEPT